MAKLTFDKLFGNRPRPTNPAPVEVETSLAGTTQTLARIERLEEEIKKLKTEVQRLHKEE